MKQFIAPQVLKVNGAPSPCECTEDVICAYCVQANLLLWEREERIADKRNDRLCEEIKRLGVRRVAKNIGVRHQTVAGWTKSGRVNPSYLAPLEQVIATLG